MEYNPNEERGGSDEEARKVGEGGKRGGRWQVGEETWMGVSRRSNKWWTKLRNAMK